MGVKARVIPGFLDRVLEEEVPARGTIVDLMSGTGIVAAFCADRYRVFANDAQEYAHVIARSLIEHDPGEKEVFLQSVDAREDLFEAFRENLRALEGFYAPALKAETALLERFAAGEDDSEWCRDYRTFLEEPGSVYGAMEPDGGGNGHGGLYAGAGRLLSEGSLASYRTDAGLRPRCLVTAYYANVYFGLRQSLEIDSLRAAIDDMDSGDPHAGLKRVHYLSALLHAASISTSGTSHFAQPRHLHKDSELCAMAKRRRIDIFSRLEECSGDILATGRETRHLEGNGCFVGDYRGLIEEGSGGPCFRFPGKVDLVYLDPPYTADNYSRFYHALEALARYDYPALDTGPGGRILRGRYPQGRFQSGFCSKETVEDEFRRVILAAAGAGAKLVVSYASPTGLLLKRYARKWPADDPVKRMEGLCLEGFRDVRTARLPMMHSGQGDRNLRIEELLVVCTRPRT